MRFTGSCRRHFIDGFLRNEIQDVSGRILDIGGKKRRPRGSFRMPDRLSVEYLNVDSSTNPDYLCSADDMILDNEQYDAFLLIEVLEHLERPVAAIQESFRVTKSGGTGLITMPFLYPVHADPHDLQRWTADKLSMELERTGFYIDRIDPMGGAASCIFDICWTLVWRLRWINLRRAGLLCCAIFKPLALGLDRIIPFKRFVTTGWSARVHKL